VPQITKKPPAKKASTPNGTANGTADSTADGTPEKAPADGEPPSNGPLTPNGDAANGGKPLPGVRTLLEFVAWVVFTHQVGSGRAKFGAKLLAKTAKLQRLALRVSCTVLSTACNLESSTGACQAHVGG
jgi:hypothetical protein